MLVNARRQRYLEPVGPTCTICAHPRVAELHARIASESVKSLAAELEMSSAAAYRHLKSGHHHQRPQQATAIAPGSTFAPATTPRPIDRELSATLRDVKAIVRAAKAHLRRAKSGADLKATNGAITAASKALELIAKLRGELQSGTKVDVNVSAVAMAAVDAQEQAAEMTPGDVIDAARDALASYIEAGDAHAARVALELVRMIPGADASTEDQAVTGATSRSDDAHGQA